MPKPSTLPADAAQAAYSAISAAEGDMRAVYDYALILHDYMSEPGDLDAARRGALSWLTCELVAHGARLKEHHDAMHAAAVAMR